MQLVILKTGFSSYFYDMIRTLFVGLTLVSSAFIAPIASAQTVAFSEDFETGMNGWTVVIEDTSTVNAAVIEFAPGWITLPDPINTVDTVCGATSYFTTPGKARRWLISPAITLGAYGNILRWSGRSHDPSYPDYYQIILSSTTNDISAFTDTIGSVPGEYEDWFDYEVNISDQGYVSQTIYVAFVLDSYDKYKLYLDDISMTIDDPVGITEDELNWVEVYPNPASTVVRLKTDKVVESVSICNSTGQLVNSTPYTSSGIDVSTLPSGIYFVRISAENTVTTKRLVIR